MEHPFFPTTTTRAEALRWLTIAEKLLSTRDLMGSKSFASRAREADPTLSQSDQILAVADTLLAGDRRIGNNQHDLYAILRLTPQQGRDAELVSSQYRSLALILNPQKNKFPFAEQAFRLVADAWAVLSNPSRKMMYDRELAFYLHPQEQQSDPFGNPIPAMHQNFNFFGGSTSSGGSGSGVAHISQPQSAVHFPQAQVPASSQVDPSTGGSAREAHNFMSFTSGSNIAFGSGSGSGSGSKAGHETLNRQTQESYTTYASNMTSAEAAPGASQGQVNNESNEQQEGTYSNTDDKAGQNVDEGENDGERIEDEGDVEGIDEQEEEIDAPVEDGNLVFWTACPYCYYMYEYPTVYVDCTLRCQNCKSAFQAVAIPSPPPIDDGREASFCCWGFMPMGFSTEQWEKNKGSASTWTPFSPMFTCPQSRYADKNAGRKSSAPRVYVDDDEVFVEVTDSSGSDDDDDDDWGRDEGSRKKKKAKTVKAKGASGTPNRSVKKKAQIDKGKNVDVQDGFVPPPEVETANKTDRDAIRKEPAVNARKQRGRPLKNFGKLDLNVECSNEGEEAAPRVNPGHGLNRGEDENIVGNGFFEGLDEFLSSLPILNVVGDDKVVKAA